MKTVLITGASGGIGSAAALAFAKAGYALAITYQNNRDAALDVQTRCRAFGVPCHVFCADLTKVSACQNVVNLAKDALGHIDVLIHCAGRAHIEFFDRTDEETYDTLFDLNMKSSFFLSQAVCEDMIRRKSGTILLLSSMWGKQGASMEVAYSASKAAVNGFVQALARELAPSHIAVIGIAPGAVDTPMNANLSESDRAQLIDEIPIGRFITPDEVASLLLFAASENALSLTGQILSPTGGLVL